jgi:hypothetical protein
MLFDAPATIDAEPAVFGDPMEHLVAELDWLDLLLARGMRNLGAAPSANPGVYITGDEAAGLIGTPPAVRDTSLDAGLELLRAGIDETAARSARRGVRLPLRQLADRLGLSAVERQALIICLAPELDRKYDRIYAYLQDDITRKRPSVDLVVGLVEQNAPDRWRALRLFAPDAPLLGHGLLQAVVDQYSPSGSTALAQLLQVAPRIVGHVLGDDQLDGALRGRVRLIVPTPGPSPADATGALERELSDIARREGAGLLVYVQGDRGAGRSELVRAVAAGLGRPLLEANVSDAGTEGPGHAGHVEQAALLRATLRESWLLDAPVLISTDGAAIAPGFIEALDDAMRERPSLVFITGERPWPSARRPRHCGLHHVALPGIDPQARRAAWASALARASMTAPPELVGRFRLAPDQIRTVVDDVARAAGGRQPEPPQWYSACRRICEDGLATLATRVTHLHRADELLIGEEQCQQLRALRDQVRYRDLVFDEWGMGARFTDARGLSALFTGPPGTGKTMAAGVVAGELGLDLYRIDLSRVVSKYIGETEKNLAAVFDAAERSNAVLFCDEADALFGKRTKVSDSHDRYANIETSYLLQRMEEYQGIVVLATNLRQNMDEAFTRRLQFVIEFPFPDRLQRLRIWQSHLHNGPPLAPDLDDEFLVFLADRLPLSGGGIRNAVLSAAFLAASGGGSVGTGELLAAARSEFVKSGALLPELTRATNRQTAGARS